MKRSPITVIAADYRDRLPRIAIAPVSPTTRPFRPIRYVRIRDIGTDGTRERMRSQMPFAD